MKTATVLAGTALDGGDFVIAEWRDPGGGFNPPRFIAPPHLHRRDDEARYVLEGTLHIRAGSETIAARAGSAVLVPRGTPHTYWNPASEPARYLLVMTPNIHSLIKEIHEMPDRSAAALRTVFAKHDSEYLD